MHFIQENLQYAGFMASYNDSMNAVTEIIITDICLNNNRNYISFQRTLDFAIIVPVLQCWDVLGSSIYF